MKMTGYYLFSQALSVAMFESSIVITILGVEPFFSPPLQSDRERDTISARRQSGDSNAGISPDRQIGDPEKEYCQNEN